MNKRLPCRVLRWPDAAACAHAARREHPANAAPRGLLRAAGVSSRFWKPGRTLKIAFEAGPAADHKAAILLVASEWLEYANLKFEAVDDLAEAVLRVAFDADEDSASYPGTDALAATGPTMILNCTPDDPGFRATVLHEFGHALGASHEHQHPDADIQWNIEAVYAEYVGGPTSRQDIDDNFFARLSAADTLATPYDPLSIMHYPVDGRLTLNGVSVGHNTELSELDKAFMRRAYPASPTP